MPKAAIKQGSVADKERMNRRAARFNNAESSSDLSYMVQSSSRNDEHTVHMNDEPTTGNDRASIKTAERNRATIGERMRGFMRYATPRRPLLCCLITLILLALLIGLAILIVYFAVWRGMPNIEILTIQKPEGKDGAAGVNIDLGEPGKRPPSMSMDLNIYLRIYNPNKIDIAFDRADVFGALDIKPEVTVAQGAIPDVFMPREEWTYTVLPMSFKYNFGDDNSNAIPLEVVKSCTMAPGKTEPEKQMQMTFKIDAFVRLLGFVRFQWPRITNGQAFDCPYRSQKTFKFGTVMVSLDKIDWNALSRGQFGLLP